MEIVGPLDEWLATRLDPSQREKVQGAKETALRELARECSLAPDRDLVIQAGLPQADVALRLLAGMRSLLA